ncbi:MAG: NADH dehydrogenase, partial [Clostridia bacterium]|nr:NADH dehydrogenase [Clostridia bacterium]
LVFEVMSFTSYTWVAHEQNERAMRAANTYIAVAVIGGLVALMGLFLLDHALGTLQISALYEASHGLTDKSVLYIAGGCLLFGFGAKAGMFPLHIWLPKAHPVAPAPASALLSGVLTKTGIFGVLVISCEILRYDHAWGIVIVTLGTITMVLGAVLALLSVDLKRALACSSMSQIGFILIGIAMQCLLGEENALAANGTMLHMVNHSLIKLDLFMVAGVVYMNTHTLDLNKLKGWGKGKPILNLCFLLGLLGIGGIPGFNGYISKTLLHEAIVEYAHHSHLAWVTVVEWLFLISGGITLTYMSKLYICLFVLGDKPKDEKRCMSPLSAFAILTSALLIPALGLTPHLTMDRIAHLGTHFMHAGEHAHAVHYFIWMNLKGAVICIIVAIILYLLVVQKLLMKKQDGQIIYLNRLPAKMDLEDLFYRPLLLVWLPTIFGTLMSFFGENKILKKLCSGVMKAISTLTKWICDLPQVTKHLQRFASFVFAMVCNIPDGIVYLLRKTIYRDSPFTPHEHRHYALIHGFGALIDGTRRLLGLPPREDESYAELMTDAASTIAQTTRGIASNFSFALLMACIGICMAIVYLLFIPR